MLSVFIDADDIAEIGGGGLLEEVDVDGFSEKEGAFV